MVQEHIQALYDDVAHELDDCWAEMMAENHDHTNLESLVSRINRLRTVATWLVLDKSAKDWAEIVHRYQRPRQNEPLHDDPDDFPLY